jgi:hypothetical protein
VQGKAVPSDLAWLVTQNGLALTGLFALMKRAKAVGHRLSNVIAVVGDVLIRLKGKELFAYIQALLSKTVDYAFVAEQQATQAERAKGEAAAAVAAEISDLVSRLRGVQVTRADGAVLSVDEASEVIEKSGRRAAAPHALALDLLREMAARQANDGQSAFAPPYPDSFKRGRSLTLMEAQLAAAREILLGARCRRTCPGARHAPPFRAARDSAASVAGSPSLKTEFRPSRRSGADGEMCHDPKDGTLRRSDCLQRPSLKPELK